jgi:protein involved in polysaccharide export with SLBB domain
MQQVTLRLRGPKAVQKLLGKKGKSRAATAAEILETESEEDLESEDEDLVAQEVANEEADLSLDEDDNASIASVDTAFSKASAVDFEPRIVEGGAPLQIVIEDSEDEI